MSARSKVRNSKFLSLVLRHRPDLIGVELDECGWVDVSLLLEKCADHGHAFTRQMIDEIVATNSKQRFAFSPDGSRIRANQGHSVDVELGYEPAEPPEARFHGTVETALSAIRTEGLSKMARHHVHLSADRQTAANVGRRRGKAIVLQVHAGPAARAGHIFYISTNGVWLTDRVPPKFIDFPRRDDHAQGE